MSWSANRTTIVSGLPSGYTLIPDNREPDDDASSGHRHKSYSLKLAGTTDLEYQTADEMHYSHTAILRAIFTHVDGTILITNEGLAMTLMQTISNIAGFHTYAEDPTAEFLDNKHTIWNYIFHFGFDDNV